MNRAASALGTPQGRPQLPPALGSFFWRWRFIEHSNFIQFAMKKAAGIYALRLPGSKIDCL
jgi:hypothetical protein